MAEPVTTTPTLNVIKKRLACLSFAYVLLFPGFLVLNPSFVDILYCFSTFRVLAWSPGLFPLRTPALAVRVDCSLHLL